MRFSLVTTCYNECKSFPRWKEDALRQTRIPDEICIVDAASNDGTTELLRSWEEEDTRVRLKVKKCNPAKGRNLAVSMSSGDVVVSTDMGCRIDENWFSEMCRPFETNSDIGVVAGDYSWDMDTVSTAAAWGSYYIATASKRPLGPGFLPSNKSVAYHRWAWNKLGGLPEDLTFASDDSVMSLQLLNSDIKIAYAKKALVFWGRPEKLREYWKEAYRYLYGNGEAGIIRPPLKHLLRGSSLFIKPYLIAFALLLCKSTLTAMIRACRDGHLAACFMIPILRFGIVINYAWGFRAGTKSGRKKCMACRQRLANIHRNSSNSMFLICK